MNTKLAMKIPIPTNVITGFLGVGKTSAILHWLTTKPKHERWAVLVNEFGEIGVDGSLFEGQHAAEQGVFIREVPGGCMCCTAGLPMQIALSQLLARAKPDRLLIEPTGLGHPKEVLQTLAAEHYRETLRIQKTLTLVDARNISDSRYTSHDTFNQQLLVADTIVANKLDLYSAEDRQRLMSYIADLTGEAKRIIFSQHAEIDIAELEGDCGVTDFSTSQHQHGVHNIVVEPRGDSQNKPRVVKAENEGEGFHSMGWRFGPDLVFMRQALFNLLTGLNVERMKAVFITDEGIFGYNLTADALLEIELDDSTESRIEIISESPHPEFEAQLMSCIDGDVDDIKLG